MVKSFLVVSYETVMELLFKLPRFHFFGFFKKALLTAVGAKIGKRVVFYPGVWICPGRNLVIGDDVDLAKDVIVTTTGGVRIGSRSLIGYRTQILSSNHTIPPAGEPFPISGDEHQPVSIEEDVWVGANCILAPGVRIGCGAVVGAGSVVTRDVPPNSVVAGVPAKLIRMREGA